MTKEYLIWWAMLTDPATGHPDESLHWIIEQGIEIEHTNIYLKKIKCDSEFLLSLILKFPDVRYHEIISD